MAEAVRQVKQASPAEFRDAVRLLPSDKRLIVAIAGSPGAGKSTFADWLADELNADRPGAAAVLPMDGFHFDDLVLNVRGHRPRKGAPHTFDTGGLAATLRRLAADDGGEIAVPVFDRSIEIARAGARIIGPRIRTVVVEGNYLLLDHPDWAPLRAHFDLTAMLDVPEETLRQRLTERWAGFGFSGEALEAKLAGNDLINMRIVLEQSLAPDIRVTFGQPAAGRMAD